MMTEYLLTKLEFLSLTPYFCILKLFVYVCKSITLGVTYVHTTCPESPDTDTVNDSLSIQTLTVSAKH